MVLYIYILFLISLVYMKGVDLYGNMYINVKCQSHGPIPIKTMYGIFTYICYRNQLNKNNKH